MARRPGRVAAAEAAAQTAGLDVPGADERPRLGPAYPLGGRNQKAGLAQGDIGTDVPHHATGDLSGEPGAVDRAALAVVVVPGREQDPPCDVCWLTTAKEHFDLINLCGRNFTPVGLQPGIWTQSRGVKRGIQRRSKNQLSGRTGGEDEG